MNTEDDTQEFPLEGPGENRDDQAEPDLGPWGTEAVQLGVLSRDRMSTDSSAHRPQATPRRWIALAGVCAVGLFTVIGSLMVSGGSTSKEIDSKRTMKTDRQPPVVEGMSKGPRAAHRAKQRRRQVRRRASRRPPATQPHTTHPAPSPTYAPIPQPDPAPEPVAPSPAPAPALTPTTKPPDASGPTVAKEFGFER